MRMIGHQTKQLVDQVFVRGRGWIDIRPTPLRRMWGADKRRLMQGVESVHLVELGDYRVNELSRSHQ